MLVEIQAIIFYGFYLEGATVVFMRIKEFLVTTTIALLTFLIVMTVSFVNAETKKYFIDTPNPCVKVEKIEKNKVYLAHTKENCIQTIGKVQVEVDNSYKSVFTYVDSVLWKEQPLQEFNLDTIKQQMDLNEKLKNSIKIPENAHKKKGGEEALKSANVFYSKEFQEKLNKETERLKQTVFNKPMEIVKKYYKDAGKDVLSLKLADNERIYIFISSSVPLSTLRNYAADIDKLGGQNVFMVMRGMKNGMKYMKPTIEFVSSVIKKDQSCDMTKTECDTYSAEVQIDPLLFRRYGIDKVPAIVYATGVDVMDIQGSEGIAENAKVNDFYVIYGDMALDYALERINEEVRSKNLEGIIKGLRAGFYQK